nr:immunoglobulin heavy chain junction region [Mus musculus]
CAREENLGPWFACW